MRQVKHRTIAGTRTGWRHAMFAACVALTLAATPHTGLASAPPLKKCASFKVHGAKASQIRARGPSCARAKSVIREYFKPGNGSGSTIQGYECEAVFPLSTGRVLCISGEYTIRWKLVAA